MQSPAFSSLRSRASVTGVSAAALALTLVLAGCGGSSKTASDSTTATPGSSSATGDPSKVNITITAAGGCVADRTTAAAGALTFTVTNKDATAVSETELTSGERIVGEKENLPPGFSGSFAVNVDAGTYSIYCPGAATQNSAFTVTGTASSGTGDTSVDALLATGTQQYGTYVNNQMSPLVETVAALQKTLQGTDLAAAQAAYMKARPYYEKIEPVAESFTVGSDNLDANIDARAGDVPASQWGGFHRIEQGLFQKKSLAGLSTYGAGLVTNVAKLQALTKGLTYKPFELANGAQELLDEVASTKITGEEERYSHIDLLDFQANDEAAEQAFASLQPALTKIDATLTARIAAAFKALDTVVEKYRTDANPSGFTLYTQLTTADKKALANGVKAVQEPLSQVASKVAQA